MLKELIRQITSSNVYVRKNSVKLIRKIAELQSKSVHALVSAHGAEVLVETVAPRKNLKLRHYSYQAQIGLLEGIEFCSSTSPQLFVFNMAQQEHANLFYELLPICEADEAYMAKSSASGAAGGAGAAFKTQAQNGLGGNGEIVALRKAALNTLASFYHS